MSFAEFHECIKEGDTVIVFMGRNSMLPLKIQKGKILQTTYGAFPHNDLIGKKFGTKNFSKNNKGWVYLLYPTPELWTLTLPHRTQILYTTDISMVILELDIKPGAIVVESGTGSGSMSHSIIRAIAPHGHLHTFEFHEQRAEKAREEFEEHGIAELVTVQHRDVLKDGFALKHIADAVFLDLPSPWDAIQAAKTALKLEGGRLCSFSPCIEQVQRTCDIMRQLGFQDILVMENLLRTFDVRTVPMQEPYLGPIQESVIDKMPCEDGPPTKKSKMDTDIEVINSDQVENKPKPDNVSCDNVLTSGLIKNAKTNQLDEKLNILTSKPYKEMPGHTGYLTFGTLYPIVQATANLQEP